MAHALVQTSDHLSGLLQIFIQTFGLLNKWGTHLDEIVHFSNDEIRMMAKTRSNGCNTTEKEMLSSDRIVFWMKEGLYVKLCQVFQAFAAAE